MEKEDGRGGQAHYPQIRVSAFVGAQVVLGPVISQRKGGRSAASTAAASSGSGGCGGGSLPSGGGYGSMPAHFTPTSLELKGWGDLDDVRGSAIDNDEVGSLVASFKARMTMELQGRFDWEAPQQEQRTLS